MNKNTNRPRYQISLALNEEDKRLMDEVIKSGIKQIDIFRRGLKECNKSK